MPVLVGPSHHLFHAAMHRRRLWLEYLALAFGECAQPGWKDAYQSVKSKFSQMSSKLSAEPHLGIFTPLPLKDLLDDTPVDSFLMTLSEELIQYEQQIFALIPKFTAPSLPWKEALEQTSILWGRELAQECLVTPTHGALIRGKRTLKGIFEVFHNVLEGGDFLWRPLLLRRYTEEQLQYELKACPHQSLTEQAALACHLEAIVFRSFAQALLPSIQFSRTHHQSYCMDELKI